MLAYRLCRAAYTALDGEGARLYGGRWNTPGNAVVYASSSRALAALEYLVHIDVADVPDDLVLLTIDVPNDASCARVEPTELPGGWQRASESTACHARGDAWVARGAELLLVVPSAAIPEEMNVLLNPRHPDATDVRVTERRPFVYDSRLLA